MKKRRKGSIFTLSLVLVFFLFGILRILNFLGVHLRSWSGIETVAGDKISKKNGRVLLGGWVSLHMAHDCCGIFDI